MLVGFFILAAIADYLTCLYHDNRERDNIWTTSSISMGLETLSWIPIWFALTQENVWIAIVSIVGSGVGTAIGLKKTRKA